MLKILLFVLSCILTVPTSFAQIGGTNTFEFLNLSPSARITALGGNLITIRDDDVNLALANPALLNPQMHQQLSFNHNFHFAGIQHGYTSYAQYFDKLKTTFHAGIQYVNYGEFDLTDEFFQVNGTFKASEYALTIGAGREVYERLALGANIKFISSQLEGYNSIGFTTDLAGMYYDTAANFTATIVFKNIGSQITTFREDNFEPLPFQIQLGISKRLQHLPFRFSLIYRYFERWNILFDDPDSQENTLFFGDIVTERSNSSIFFDNLFRHFIFNGEFLFGQKDNFKIRFGYNHFMRKELSVESFGGLAGFSFGLGLKINRFRIDFGRTTLHLAGGLTHIGISTNLKEFKR